MKIGKLLYGALGVLLVAATVVTGSGGLKEADLEVYRTALVLQTKVDVIGFEGLVLADYKVRFFDGDVDYVVTADGVKKEPALFATFVGTAQQVEGAYQVILPTVEKFTTLLNVMGGAGRLAQGEAATRQEAAYDSTSHIATLWHETTHAYQLTQYAQAVHGLSGGMEPEHFEAVIVSVVDQNPNVVHLYQKGTALLTAACETSEINQKKQLVQEYLTVEMARQELLTEEAVRIEAYYETVEGTARYVESRVFGFLQGDDEMTETYLGTQDYIKGAGKYYTSGMIKCHLLDELAPNWQHGYDFSQSPTALLQGVCEGK